MLDEGVVLFHDKDKVRVGSVFRYDVYLESPLPRKALHVRIRNTELGALRAAYLNGPFTLYVDITPMDYSEYVKTPRGADPEYENHLKAGSHFSADLHVRRPQQRWRISIISEILFSRTAEVGFEITIGTTKHAAKMHGSKAGRHVGGDPLATEFKVNKFDTSMIWQQPLPDPDRPLHVCVLTHGLVSNVTADMLYLKEILDQTADMSGENLICKGYTGNVCRTERGVKYLGKRLANWLVNELIPTYKPARLSFVAHSLGGLIQTYALGFIEATNPDALKGIELVNFVALASPFLGISHENPGYVQVFLNFGVVGKTGRDLGLAWIPGTSRPLLERLPGKHTLAILRRFSHRTVYANAANDGIVPLRTASLLYLDWRAIGKANAVEKDEKKEAVPSRDYEESKDQYIGSAAQHSRMGTDDPPGSDGSSSQHSSPRKNSNGSIGSNSSNKLKEPKLLKKDRTTSGSSSLSSSDNPLSTFLFGGNNKEERFFTRYQTVNTSEDLDAVGEKLPKKTSLIESGMSLLLPPHPNNEFITDPSCRSDVIFHDRMYYQQDLPKPMYKSKLLLKTGTKEKVDVAKSEERIARSYHSGTSWRKVLVQLLPEAHNNIIVRRRFSNAYGWPVVHHVAREHFLFPAARDTMAEDLSILTNNLNLESSDDAGSSKPEISPWSESDDDEKQTGAEHDHDPHRASMFKIVPQN